MSKSPNRRKPYQTPGPGSYGVESHYNRASTKQAAPAFSFGTQKMRMVELEMEKEKKQHRPGPGSYISSGSCGAQIISARPSSPQFSFGTSIRDHASKTYVSKADSGPVDMNRVNAGRDTPGPGSYANNMVTKRQAPQYSFGLKPQTAVGVHRPNTSPTVGPGRYENRSGMGNQNLSVRASSPTYSIGTSSREKCNQVISPGFSAHSKMTTPGPGTYGSVSSISKQVTSTQKSPFSCGFGKGEKLKRDRDRGVPGPGEYQPPSSVGRQPKSTFSSAPAFGFGSSEREPLNAGLVG
mmetsp:Transcript_14303/g.18679  ORF Transcript_14303/g.18679 Transcript_14303/m.18679 type:complete len:295 (+) Transcript_14303:275-1159(+)|eukprot:CAMPEP_0117757824 /NCGR_PEP_ID=MMETSP0947-20121206/14978_1 /TAXON_ID=44440 /ORGANISM="Chattonella subsalsa, Strain CCMP2191" /LENGTH=294 /DNA_ID=CAMNT_0005577825 /DNA_START=242 /DNA_END=1126 /DNA_ORIENTATION=+